MDFLFYFFFYYLIYLTQDIFEHFFENQKFINKTFDIKQLEISGNSFAIAKKIDKNGQEKVKNIVKI